MIVELTEETLRRIFADVLREELPDVLCSALRDTDASGHISGPPLNFPETCKALNLSPRKVDQLCASGELRPMYVGRKRLFPREQITALLRRAANGDLR